MDISALENDFKNKIVDQIRVLPEGKDRFRIFTPFIFDDGDHLVSILKKYNNGWIISDEGHTYMRLSYRMDVNDLEKGTRQSIIESALSMFEIIENDGELLITVENEFFGDALFSFIQGIFKIMDVSYLSRERVRSTFFEDLKSFITEKIPEERRVFDHIIFQRDPKGMYKVDCMINGMSNPLFIFGINSDGKCKDSTINLLQYEKWGIHYRSLAIFEDQETINRKSLARFSDVCDKQYSSLYLNKDRIENYLLDIME